MPRIVRGPRLLILALFALIPAALFAQDAPPPLDADKRVYPPLVLPDAEARPAAPQPRAEAAEIPWSRVVYYARGQGNWDLYISDDMGEGIQRLTSGRDMEVQPDLSRGGARVVYVSDADGDFDLYTMSASGGAAVKLLDTAADEYNPVWSPDGGRVAFQSERDGQPEVYVINADGSNLTRLTTNPDFDGHPSWSPDGARIAFSSRQNGQYRIWAMNADGGGKVRLSVQPGSLYPGWSPGGDEIAYSADGDGNGWLELWRMTATGGLQRLILSGAVGRDLQARSWAPNGMHVAYTSLEYVFYQGQWWINNTRMERIQLDAPHAYPFYTSAEYPFGPAWQTLDTAAPVSSVKPLPAVSPGRFMVRWSAADAGPAGIRSFTIQVKIDDGPWADWVKNPPGSEMTYDGVGGKTYAFRGRAIDHSLNAEPWPAAPETVTTVENLPPQTTVAPLPGFSRADRQFVVAWSGVDPGGSGIARYRAQVRRGSGAWTDWLEETRATSATFDPAGWGAKGGETLGFRIRAIDGAQNIEPWTADPGDATTTIYAWGVAGRVTDNTGTPVGEATVSTSPATLGAARSGPDGEFGRYAGSAAGPVTLSWAKDGYGVLPPTAFAPPSDAALDAALPPVGDAVTGGDFEGAGWGAWAASGSLGPTLSAEARHTGAKGALLAARPPQFGPPHPLTATPDVADHNVQLSLSGGAATVLWTTGYPDELNALRAARRAPSGVWSPATTVLDSVRYGYDMVTDSSDLIHVVAPRDNGLFYVRQNANGTWAAAEPVPGASPAQDLKLVRGPDNVLHLFWKEFLDDRMNLRYSRRAPGGGWSAPQIVATADRPDFVIYYGAAVTTGGAAQLVYVVHRFDAEEGEYLNARERRPDGSWTAPVLLMRGGRNSFHLPGDPVAGPDGRLHLMWQRTDFSTDPSRYEVYYAAKDGASWTAPQLARRDAFAGDYAVGPDGAVQALLGLMTNQLAYTVRFDDGSWLFPEPVPGVESASAELLVDGNGLAHVLRGSFDYQHTRGNIYYTRRSVAGAWLEPVNVSNNDINNYLPAAALDAGGNVHVAWQLKDEYQYYNQPDVAYAGPVASAAAGEAILSQPVTLPAGAAHPVLSFFYRFGGGASAATRLEVTVGSGPAVVLPASPGAMRHHWLDLSGRAGETAVTFRLVQAAGEPSAWAAVDDVSLGAAHGDVWLSASGGAGLPGESVAHQLVVGNRGRVAAETVVLTYTLPPELIFVSAEPAPSGLSPLRWELGAMPAGVSRPVRVVVAVSPSAEPLRVVTATAAASAAGELETHNNTAVTTMRLERRLYLPAAIRQ